MLACHGNWIENMEEIQQTNTRVFCSCYDDGNPTRLDLYQHKSYVYTENSSCHMKYIVGLKRG